MSFIHLQCHSEFSIVDGLVKLPALMSRLKEVGAPAVALTDYMNLFAAVKFFRKAMAAGIKPILGVDILLDEDGHQSRVTLLCQNKQGYENALVIVSNAYTQCQSGEPIVSWQDLQTHHAGLLVLLSGKTRLMSAILKNNDEIIGQQLSAWKTLFGDRLYITCQKLGHENEKDILNQLALFSAKYNVPLVATNDVRFIERSDFQAHEARICINQGYVLEDSRRPKSVTAQQYLRTAEQMQILFKEYPACLANTVEIAKRCNLMLTFGETFFPTFEPPEGSTIEDLLIASSQAGLKVRLEKLQASGAKIHAPDYERRLEIELGVINRMGFAAYFVIVADFIQWAKDNDIMVGPGRGSGAGSLVAYVLGITELDPLEFDLLFERFLNPERVSMPDFDVDFCMTHRDRVIDYVTQRYGHEAVSQIITYGTMAAKAVIRDVGRVMSLPYGFVDALAKLIPFELGITLDKALADEPALLTRYQEEPEVRALIDLAKKLEGVVRNAGKHAGGVVIAPTRLTDFLPLYCEPGSSQWVTQYDKDDVETVGLVKFDFLGLRTLTVISEALSNIKLRHNIDIDINLVARDHQDTFKLLQACETTAVFQLESRGMKDLIGRLVPDAFDDLVALVALFRPGPLQSGMVDDYIDRKHGRSDIVYQHPALEPILKPTYGVILYQEQVMQIAQQLAGYSLGAADLLRRAMGKKKPEEMAKQRGIFMKGAIEQGIDESVAKEIFDIMEKFAGYGFNKSHSAAYALIAYQTAWLKANYPAEFMAAVLSSDMDNTDKVMLFYRECLSMGLTMLPPSINHSVHHFKVNDDGHIRYGLGAIKGVGESVVLHIEDVRSQDGAFHSFFDFLSRIDLHKCNKRALEPLIFSGALDELTATRAAMLDGLPAMHKAAQQKQQDLLSGQVDLFADDQPGDEMQLPDVAEWDCLTRLRHEKTALGHFLSGHPITPFSTELKQLAAVPSNELQVDRSCVVAGVLISIRHIVTKQGKRMGVLTLEDEFGPMEVTLFSQLWQDTHPTLEKDAVYVVRAKTSHDKFTQGVRLLAEKIMLLPDLRSQKAKSFLVKVNGNDALNALFEGIPTLVQAHAGGRCRVQVQYTESGKVTRLMLGKQFSIQATEAARAAMMKLFGEDNVCVCY